MFLRAFVAAFSNVSNTKYLARQTQKRSFIRCVKCVKFYNNEQYPHKFGTIRTKCGIWFIIFLLCFSLSSHFFNWFFLSLLTIHLSLPTGVLSSNQTQKSSFFSLCTSNQTPIPSSKQNPKMESSQTQKEQRNRWWRRGRAWGQGRRSHEDQRWGEIGIVGCRC